MNPYRPVPKQQQLPPEPLRAPKWFRATGAYIARYVVGLSVIVVVYALLLPVPFYLGKFALGLASFDFRNHRPDQVDVIRWIVGAVLESTVFWVPKLCGTWLTPTCKDNSC